jgi:hypothetical protein
MRGNHDNTRLEMYLCLEPQVEGVGRFNGSFISACEDSTRLFLARYVGIYPLFLNPIIHFFKDLGGRGASPRITALLPATSSHITESHPWSQPQIPPENV